MFFHVNISDNNVTKAKFNRSKVKNQMWYNIFWNAGYILRRGAAKYTKSFILFEVGIITIILS